MLTRITRSEFRSQVKSVLRSKHFGTQLDFFTRLDFTHPSIASLFTVEDCKSVAFQLAQSLLLIQGEEVYSKREISDHFPNLEPFMYRDPQVIHRLDILNSFRDLWTEQLKGIQVRQLEGNIDIYYYTSQCVANSYTRQLGFESDSIAMGMMIDMNLNPGERCLYFPWDHETIVKVASDSKGSLISIFKFKHQTTVFSKRKEEIPIVLQLVTKEDLDNRLNWDDYHLIFLLTQDPQTLKLIGARSTTTNERVEDLTLCVKTK